MKYVSFALKKARHTLSRKNLHTTMMRRRFRQLDSPLDPSIEVINPEYISIGRCVDLRPYSWLYAICNDRGNKGVFTPSIEIHDKCTIGRFAHISISNRLVLEEAVLITEGVLITDSIHGYSDPTVPIVAQPLESYGPIIIGQGSWLCNGARIVGRVTVGRHCVVGANAYVDKDIPDFCVVAGVPARIIKRFDTDKQQWIRVDEPLVRRP